MGRRVSKPVLLDLYCGAGGASVGYARAGFTVVGVDIDDQPDYPFMFTRMDALSFVRRMGRGFDVIHASPPCQAYSTISAYANKTRKRALVDLLEPTRAALVATGRPYVIENVPTAPLRNPITLCGAMFELSLYRHRGFESNVSLTAPAHPAHVKLCMRNGYLPTAARPFMTITGRNGHHSRAWQAAAAGTMGTPWIKSLNGVCEAIPPAYTHLIGSQLMRGLRNE